MIDWIALHPATWLALLVTLFLLAVLLTDRLARHQGFRAGLGTSERINRQRESHEYERGFADGAQGRPRRSTSDQPKAEGVEQI